MRLSRLRFFTLLVLASLTQTAFADGPDVLVVSDGAPSPKLVIGGWNDEFNTGTIPSDQLLVFGGEAVANDMNASLPYATEGVGEPGFNAVPQSTLDNPAFVTPAGAFSAVAANTPLTFSFLPMTIGANSRNLFFWDGVGPEPSFAPVASNVSLQLELTGANPWTNAINGSSDAVIAGNTIATTSGSGFLHQHLVTTISKGGAAPDQGFFLFSLQMEMAGFTSSDPLFFVFGALNPADFTTPELEAYEVTHDLAIDWVQDNLVAPVPEPSTYAILALGAAAIPLVRRRLRRR